MASSRFKASDYTRAIRAARAAGLDAFDVVPQPNGPPLIRVRPPVGEGTTQDVLDEIREWAREA
jgi:hypothetical protein